MILLFSIKLIGFAVLVFGAIIMALSFMLIIARRKLLPQGEVRILINGDADKSVNVKPGMSLLSTLGGEGILLPSACGGGGTCGMCKCQIIAGGGDVLPTEVDHLSRKEQKEHVRLACQAKVRDNMEIQIPEEIFGIKKWECEVVSNYNVASFIKEFVVKLPEGETLDFQSGGYIQIDVPKVTVDFKDIDIKPNPNDPVGPDKFKGEWDKYKLWGLKMVNDEEIYRAYSMANHPAEGNIVMLNIRIATPPWDKAKGTWSNINPGICSSYIFSRKPGDKVVVSGPYGEFFIKKTDKEKVYVGGGAGMAPLRSHIFHMFHTLKTKDKKVSYWYGGRSVRELFYVDQFEKIDKEYENFSFNIALSDPLPEDNWEGYTGFIHQVLYDNYLKNHPEPEEIEYYLCGPPLMNAACLKLFDELGVPKENIMFDDFGG